MGPGDGREIFFFLEIQSWKNLIGTKSSKKSHDLNFCGACIASALTNVVNGETSAIYKCVLIRTAAGMP